MNVIGNAFKKLFLFLVSIFSTLFDVIWDGIKWIGNLLRKLFQNLLDVLIGFFKVIYALIDGLLYLLYMIGVLAVKLFLVIFEASKTFVVFDRWICPNISKFTLYAKKWRWKWLF